MRRSSQAHRKLTRTGLDMTRNAILVCPSPVLCSPCFVDQHCETGRTTVGGHEEYAKAKLMVCGGKERKRTGESNDCCLSLGKSRVKVPANQDYCKTATAVTGAEQFYYGCP